MLVQCTGVERACRGRKSACRVSKSAPGGMRVYKSADRRVFLYGKLRDGAETL